MFFPLNVRAGIKLSINNNLLSGVDSTVKRFGEESIWAAAMLRPLSKRINCREPLKRFLSKYSLCKNPQYAFLDFNRAMHFSAKRGIAIACRLSVCMSVTLVNCDHIG